MTALDVTLLLWLFDGTAGVVLPWWMITAPLWIVMARAFVWGVTCQILDIDTTKKKSS